MTFDPNAVVPIKVSSIVVNGSTWNSAGGLPLGDWSFEEEGDFVEETVAEQVGVSIHGLMRQTITVTIACRAGATSPALNSNGTVTVVETAASGASLTWGFATMTLMSRRKIGPGESGREGRVEMRLRQKAATPAFTMS